MRLNKIVIISHALVDEVNRKRWELLAKDFNYEVHLLIPDYWESNWFGQIVQYRKIEERVGNFYIHPMPVTNNRNWARYLFVSLDIKLISLKPDLIYVVHEENKLIHLQVSLYRYLWTKNAKVIFFSMNGRGVPQKNIFQILLWSNIRKYTDAAIVHYPGCHKSLRDANYRKPIYLQTQIGVDDNLFFPDEIARKKIRVELGIKDSFVIGFAGRLIGDKGVDDLVEVFHSLKDDIFLLLVGNGELRDSIEKRARVEGWSHRLHITGFVEQKDVPLYMNAMDLFVIGSKTFPHWIDTFPLVSVQAQACGVPVLSSDSASLPWQLGDTALFYSEGKRSELKNKISLLIDDAGLRKRLGNEGLKRSLDLFCIPRMNLSFHLIAQQVLNAKTEYHSDSEPYTQWKAYR